MKLTYKGEHDVQVVADNPDESMKEYYINKIRSALYLEWENFLEEVSVTLRNLKSGESVTIRSKPISVTLERSKPEQTEKHQS